MKSLKFKTCKIKIKVLILPKKIIQLYNFKIIEINNEIKVNPNTLS